jgi:hypothetical protein
MAKTWSKKARDWGADTASGSFRLTDRARLLLNPVLEDLLETTQSWPTEILLDWG